MTPLCGRSSPSCRSGSSRCHPTAAATGRQGRAARNRRRPIGCCSGAAAIWNWFDPLTVIRAVARLAERRDDVKLLFLGMTASRAAPSTAMTMADRARALAHGARTATGVRSSSTARWVPYDEREAWFAEADLGVSAHSTPSRRGSRSAPGCSTTSRPGRRSSSRAATCSRSWSEARGLGRVVEPGDVEGWTAALEELLDDDGAYAAARASVTAAQGELTGVVPPCRSSELIERVAASPRGAACSGNRCARSRRRDAGTFVAGAPWLPRHRRRGRAGRSPAAPALRLAPW